MRSFRFRGARCGAQRAVFIALAIALATAAGAASAAATPLGANLIVNGGAEDQGLGATDLSRAMVVPTGWVTTAGFTAVQYAIGGLSDLNTHDATAIGGGTNYFAGGPASPLSTATQRISFDDLASDVDAGKVMFLLTGYIGGWATQGDAMTVRATFLSAANAVLFASLLGPVSTVDRLSDSQLLFATSGLTGVPVGARSVNIAMTATRTDGAYNDGYADNLSLLFQEPGSPSRDDESPSAVPEPASLSLLGLGFAALFARRLKR